MKNTMKSVKQDSFSHTYLLYFIPGKSTSTTTEYEYLKQQQSNKKGQLRSSSNGTQNKETRKHLHSNNNNNKREAATTTRKTTSTKEDNILKEPRTHTYTHHTIHTHRHRQGRLTDSVANSHVFTYVGK